MNNPKGVLAIISGFSGAGKGTVVKELLSAYADEYALSVSATTRAPRQGEVDGVHYFFITKEAFEQRIAEGGFLEHAQYVDNYYGTPLAFVEEQSAKGVSVILEIEIQGALSVKERYPDAVTIFVTPPTAEELERRLRGRGTDAPDVIEGRLSRAGEEAKFMDRYDYVVINETDQVEACANTIHNIIRSAKLKSANQMDLIERCQQELAVYQKGE